MSYSSLVLLLLVPHLTFAQTLSSLAPPATFTDRERAEKLSAAFPAIDSLVAAFVERQQVPGAAYGIVVDGALAHIATVGIRDVTTGASVDTATVFRIASMTKSFTAAAILQLRDAGLLALDHEVELYIPELSGLRYPTKDSPKITIRHLLTHSEGFPEDNPWGDQQLAATDEEMSAMMTGGIPFSTAPGTAYEYSNFGYAILGRIVTNVSGMPYPKYVRESVLAPLGMHSTTLEAASVPPERLAHGYRLQDDEWLEENQLPDGAFGPMGGMLTSISDLATWVGFMLNAWPPRDEKDEGPILRASLREMQQVARYTGAFAARHGEDVSLSAGGYGFGLGIRQTCVFPSIVSHSGGLPGFGSIMRWLPEYGVGFIALGNRTYTGWFGISEQALELLAGTGALQPRLPQPSPVLLKRHSQVSSLVAAWNDSVADSMSAMNLYLDESKSRRRAEIERLVAEAGGECRNEGPIEVENALRGAWRMRCRNGDLRVSITLAPTEPAKVQYLNVRPIAPDESLNPFQACR